jgi:hypothetical protein
MKGKAPPEGVMAQPRYLTPEQLLQRWEGVVVAGTLSNWRSRTNKGTPTGPAFIKFGSKVRYPIAAVEAYEHLNFNGQQGE